MIRLLMIREIMMWIQITIVKTRTLHVRGVFFVVRLYNRCRGRGGTRVPIFEPEDTLYFGDILKIKHAYFEYKSKIYVTRCICAVERTDKPAKRPWNFLLTMGGAACVLFGIRSLFVLQGIDGTFYVMLAWLLLAAVLFIWAHRYNQTNIPEYSLIIHRITKEPLTISFADDEFERDDAFFKLLKALEHTEMITEEEISLTAEAEELTAERTD